MKHIILKLANNDDVMGRLVNEDNQNMFLEDPMKVTVIETGLGTSLYVTRYAPFAAEKILAFPKRNVVVGMTVKRSMVRYYEKCVKSFEQSIDKQFAKQMDSVDNETSMGDNSDKSKFDDDWLKEYFKKFRPSGNNSIH